MEHFAPANFIFILIALTCALFGPIPEAMADSKSQLWLSPIDDVTQRGTDIHELFENQRLWQQASSLTAVIILPANYLVRTPPDIIERELNQLSLMRIRLSVSIGVLPVDKNICGDGIEGMVWPGEAKAYGEQLRSRGVQVDSFSFDLPFSNGHILKKKSVQKACEMSIEDTAEKLASSVKDLRRFYPTAKLIDVEIPTGIPVSDWMESLPKWLKSFNSAAGEPFEGMIMDVWWKFDWQASVRETVTLLKSFGIHAGVIVDDSGVDSISALSWVRSSMQNACELHNNEPHLDYLVVANWSNIKVRNIPETSPDTLTYALKSIGHSYGC